MGPVSFLLRELNLKQDNLMMMSPESWKMGALIVTCLFRLSLDKQTLQNSYWKQNFAIDGIFLTHEFICKFKSSSLWSISVSIVAIIASKSSSYKKSVYPEAILQLFHDLLVLLHYHPISFTIFWNYCNNASCFQTIFRSYDSGFICYFSQFIFILHTWYNKYFITVILIWFLISAMSYCLTLHREKNCVLLI